MKVLIFVTILVKLLIIDAEETTPVEESVTGLCGNSTEDSCEAFNSTQTPVEEQVTQSPVVTKRPKVITTTKTVLKKPPAKSNSTKKPKANADCTCDITRGGCEVNCCCDVDCSSEQHAVFTHCLPLAPRLNHDQCFPQNMLHHNNTDYKSAVTESGLLCVVQENTVLSTDFTDVPVIKTIAGLKRKLGRQNYFSWINPTPIPPSFDPDISYSQISPIWISDNSTIKQLGLPAPVGSSSLCHDTVVPKYLQDTVTSCTEPLRSASQCLELSEISFTVISSPRNFNFTQIQECTEDVCLPVIQYICTNTCTKAKIPKPTLNSARTICKNIVQSVEYKIYHNGSLGIVEVDAFYNLQNVSIQSAHLFRRSFKVTYHWASVTDKIVLRRSGSPGYESGKPIISGKQVMKHVEYNSSGEGWIHVGVAGNSGFCENRYNLLFRENLFTRCLLKVNGTCKQIQQQIWEQMLGPVANLSEVVISSFGDPQENNVEAWVPLLVEDPAPLPVLTTTVDIIFVHSLVGAVAAPQEKIIAAYISPVPTGATCSANVTTVEIQVAVRFIDKTKPAVTKFAQPPVYEIKLPQDFFYPFLSDAKRTDISFKCFVFMMFSVLCT